MKIKIYLKDTDVFYLAIQDAIKNCPTPTSATSAYDEIWNLLGKWVEYEEYVMLELDTIEGSLKVLPLSEYN